jgi:hypothetical protein
VRKDHVATRVTLVIGGNVVRWAFVDLQERTASMAKRDPLACEDSQVPRVRTVKMEKMELTV